jgi:hypothetical protein
VVAVERLRPRVRVGHPQRHRVHRIDDRPAARVRPPCRGRPHAHGARPAAWPTPPRRPRAVLTWRTRSARRPAPRRARGSPDRARRSTRRSRTAREPVRKPGASNTASGMNPRYVSCQHRTFTSADCATPSAPGRSNGRRAAHRRTLGRPPQPAAEGLASWSRPRVSCRQPGIAAPRQP